MPETEKVREDEKRSVCMFELHADIESYVSKCSVCESAAHVIAAHSQSADLPDCPTACSPGRRVPVIYKV